MKEQPGFTWGSTIELSDNVEVIFLRTMSEDEHNAADDQQRREAMWQLYRFVKRLKPAIEKEFKTY